MKERLPSTVARHFFCRNASQTTSMRRAAFKAYCVACVLLFPATETVRAADVLWSSAAGSAWLTGSNWTGAAVPGNLDVAQFGANPTAATGVGINFNAATNAGTQTTGNRIEDIGAVEITSSRAAAILFGNSSTTAGAVGKFRLRGATVNGVSDVILRNNSTQLLTLQPNQSTGNQGMSVQLGDATNNIINIDGAGGITISAVITEDTLNPGARQLTLGGSGAGVLTLSNTNTYTGKTNINSGILSINLENRLGTAPGAPVSDQINFNGGTLRWTNSSSLTTSANRGITVNSGGGTMEITAGSVFTGGAISGNGLLTKSGSGILRLDNVSSTFSGKYAVTNGQLNPNNIDTNFGPVPGSAVADYFTLSGGGVLRAAASFTIDSKRGITLGTGGGQLLTTNSGTTLTYGGKITSTGALTVTGDNANQSVVLGGDSDFSGGTTVTTATLTLTNTTGSATGSGAVIVNSTLNVGNGGTGGALSGDITNNGTVNFNRSDDSSYAGKISSTGGVNKRGAGDLSLSGNSSYGGGTTQFDGGLKLGHKNALGTGTFTIGDATTSTTLKVSSTTNLSGANAVGNAVTVVKDFTVEAGSSDLELSGGVALGAVNRTITVDSSNSTILSGVIADTGGTSGITKAGGGVLTLTGANTYGTVGVTSTTVSAGTLLVNTPGPDSGTGVGNVLVNGGKLGGTGRIGGSVTVTSGDLSPGASINVLDIGGNLTMSGGAFDYEINSSTATADLNTVSGNLSLSTVALSASELGSGILAMGTKFTLINYGGNWNGGTFTGLPNYSSTLVIGANRFAIKYNDTTGGSNFGGGSYGFGSGQPHYVTITAVPEASTFLVIGLGGVFAFAAVRLGKRMGINVLKA